MQPYVVITHKPTGNQFTLDRAYRLMGEYDQEPKRGISTEGSVDYWDGYTCLCMPDWTEGLRKETFMAHWMY